ncbi:Hypothetical protein PBC10988_0190 [Planctomycetales bacterium 10988]|nr:Hypothetical protein PBC10988_0190 [Planctomycetales bacterium 10988]
MDQKSSSKTDLGLAELLAIQAMRLADHSQEYNDSEIDLEVASKTKGKNGTIANPEEALALRAEAFLEKHTLLSVKKIEWALWAGKLLFGITYFMAFMATGYWASRVLPAREVNLAGGFLYFLFIQILFLIPGILVLIPPTWWKYVPGMSWVHRKIFRFGTGFGWVIQFLRNQGLDRWLLPEDRNRTNSKGRQTSVGRELFDYLMQQSAPVNAITAVGSHTFWLILSGGVLFVLFGMMIFEQYNFQWRTTLLSENSATTLVEWAGAPLEPFLEIPQETEIHWLLTGELPAGKDPATEPEVRARWAWFVLAVLVAYAVIPRLICMLIARWQAKRSKENFRPDLTDPYFKEILKRLDSRDWTTETTEAPVRKGDKIEKDLKEILGPKPPPLPHTLIKQISEAVRHPESTNTKALKAKVREYTHRESNNQPGTKGQKQIPNDGAIPIEAHLLPGSDSTEAEVVDPEGVEVESETTIEPTPKAPPKLPDYYLLVGLEMDAPPSGWNDVLQLNEEVEEFGPIESLASRKKLWARLDELKHRLTHLVILAEMTNTPTVSTKRFFEQLDSHLQDSVKRFLLLTGGEEYRQRTDGELERIEGRKRQWTEMAEYGRFSKETVRTDFDHHHATAASRRWLRGFLSGNGSSDELKRAGKFAKAVKLMTTSLQEMAKIDELEAYEEEAKKLTLKIDELYQKEDRQFWEWAEKLPWDQQKREEAARLAEAMLEGTSEPMQEGWRFAKDRMTQGWNGLERVVRGLDARWMTGGAIAGALAAFPMVPALSIPAIALPYLIPTTAVAGAGISQWGGGVLKQCHQAWDSFRKREPSTAEIEQEAGPSQWRQATFQAMILWTLVLELQGNDEERIAMSLEKLLEGIEPNAWQEASEIERDLQLIQGRLEELI